MNETNPCPECVKLQEESRAAQRAVFSYRPMHTGHRARSRWFKDDRQALEQLERERNLAAANYRLHAVTHNPDEANVRDVKSNLNIVLRDGRLMP